MLNQTRISRISCAPIIAPAPTEASTAQRTLVDKLWELRQQVAAEGQARFDRWRPTLKRLAFRPGALNMARYQRAERVMLNKGDFLLEALGIVDDVFRRMDRHQHKKTARLCALRVWT